ncbi:CrcB family protein [Occultella glacieicola]|uniref:Fluoride-specific ion channel FluC n=1 Tax=Occultella glacieicola TaxID=2518684 RepID=A0ABY2DYH6_9MICO|nr:CrcB family protein [Occultella glacieicola]TDE88815.1 CrcB family protein [Occultella glacieicola]
MSRPAHRDPRFLAVVALGGAAGTLARYGLGHLLPHDDGLPVATAVENLLGAFALGLLLEALVRRGAETRTRRLLRLGLGTGMLGGFTTFSSLALEVQQLLADGQVALGLGYGLGSVVLGLAACLAGVALAGARHRRRAAGSGGPG